MPKGKWQLLFVVYRWIISLYFLAWLVAAGIDDGNGGPKYFIYLTNWAFILFNLYLLVAAIAVTLQFAIHCANDNENSSRTDLYERQNSLLCKDSVVRVFFMADYSHKVVWYQKIQWLLISMGLEMAIGIPILYWTIVYNSNHDLNGVNFNTHLVNGVVALFDICFSGIIIRLLHIVYLLFFGAVYAIFSVIYYASDGTNALDKPYIYPALDYGNRLGQALLYVFLTLLIFIPLIHLVIYGVYGARQWLVKKMCKRESVADTEEVISI